MLKRFNWWLAVTWRPLVLWTVAFSFLVVALGIQLPTTTGQFSQLELNYIESANSLNEILQKPDFMPHKLLTLAAQKLSFEPGITLRLPSAIVASLSALVGLIFIRKYFSARMSVIAGILTLTSSWFLSLGRLALPDVSFLFWIIVFALWYWLKSTSKKRTALILLTLASGLAVYVPSFLPLIIIFWFWDRRVNPREKLHISTWHKALCVCLLLIMLSPMAYSFFYDPKNILSLVGMPTIVPLFSSIITSFKSQVAGIFVINESGPIYTVGRLPLLDVFTSVFFLLGLYAQRFNRQNTVFWTSTVSVYLIMLSLGGPLTSAVFLPAIYFLACQGLRFFLQQWFTVFPRNPIARAVGTGLLSVAVALVAFYHLNRYFIVWPNAPATRQTFNYSLLE